MPHMSNSTTKPIRMRVKSCIFFCMLVLLPMPFFPNELADSVVVEQQDTLNKKKPKKSLKRELMEDADSKTQMIFPEVGEIYTL